MRYVRPTSGFSVIEVLVVVGIFFIVSGLGLFVSLESYRGSCFNADRDLLVALLERARAESMSNTCYGSCTDGMPHGVHVDTANNTYVIFQGAAYASADPINSSFEANPSIIKTGSDVVFSELTGATVGATFTLSGGGRISTVTISTDGQISWTN